MKRHHVFVYVTLCSLLLQSSWAWAQVREEQQEKTLEAPKLQPSSKDMRWTSRIGLFFGYESNPALAPLSKGDGFQELLYSLGFQKRLGQDLRFSFNYDLDAVNYNEITDVSSILNHFRLGLHKKLSWFDVGTGYDLGISEYPRYKDGDFFFHKGFFYIKDKITQKISHQLLLEAGIKDHTSRKAMDDSLFVDQDKELLERRQAIEYSIGASLTPRLTLRFRTKFSLNNSNDRYQDYNDYKSYEHSAGLTSKLSERFSVLAALSYLRRDFDERLVSSSGKGLIDNIYAANLGLRYTINDNNIVSVTYGYRNNASNDSLNKYTDNVVSCGWQYNF